STVSVEPRMTVTLQVVAGDVVSEQSTGSVEGPFEDLFVTSPVPVPPSAMLSVDASMAPLVVNSAVTVSSPVTVTVQVVDPPQLEPSSTQPLNVQPVGV